VPEHPLSPIARYYGAKVTEHGPTARGVDWNDELSHETRLAQIVKVCDGDQSFTLNDYGCGYGAMISYLEAQGRRFTYTGFDISERMLEAARASHGTSERIRWVSSEKELEPADYSVACGIFNVKLNAERPAWEEHVLATLNRLNALSTRGFAFNILTSYSDPEKMRSDLYYADPHMIFDYCKRHFSPWIALLHDYGLYEFTILVRKTSVDE
jgi:SAM-dependent methyltransferase